MERLEVVIDDRLWPQLTINISRTTVNGVKSTKTRTILYDQAYNMFEGDLHNVLRPMVDNLIRRHDLRNGR